MVRGLEVWENYKMISEKKCGNLPIKKHKTNWNESCNKSVPVIKFRYDRGGVYPSDKNRQRKEEQI